jgi:hypothetical protein
MRAVGFPNQTVVIDIVPLAQEAWVLGLILPLIALCVFRTKCPWLADSLNTTALIEEFMFPITEHIYIGFQGMPSRTPVRHGFFGFGNRMGVWINYMPCRLLHRFFQFLGRGTEPMLYIGYVQT